MMIYSVTVKIEVEINDDWVDWMKAVHIPDVMKTGKFVDSRFCKVLVENETDGFTYNIQYRAESMSDYFDYQHEFAPALQKEHMERYKDKFVAFRTLLKEI